MKTIMYELAFLFLVYSFLGWVGETIVATVKKKTFINRGFFSGPFCFIYGFSAVLMTVVLRELKTQPFFLFVGCASFATMIEWLFGKILEKLNQRKWWDYSGKKWNLDGYICFQYSILWGLLGTTAMLFFNDMILDVLRWLPWGIGHALVLVLGVLAALDGITTLTVIFKLNQDWPVFRRVNRRMWLWTIKLGNFIAGRVERRMVKAYPSIKKAPEITVEKSTCFAQGCGFVKLFWLFLIGAFIGDIVETIFCRFTMGYWMSRSSLVWGPFSIVWGLAIALATALLYKDRERPDRHIFVIGTILGGAYEYLCSVFTEIVFGKIFWDYSHLPFNLGGRVNLLFCFFWGIAAVLWIKKLYPFISGLIEKIPLKAGNLLTAALVFFMVVNMLVSMLALVRYDARAKGDPADSQWEVLMDEYFDDEWMDHRYPNAKPR